MSGIIESIEKAQLKEHVDQFNVGDTVRVYAKIREGEKERIQMFTVRQSSNGVGVEKTWPVHSPAVERIEVVRKGKVRRAKLNYLRQRVGKSAKVKEIVK